MNFLLLVASSLAISQPAEAKTFANSIGMKFVRIEAGSYRRGTGEKPPASRAEWLERGRSGTK